MKLHLPVQLLRALVLMCGLCSVQAAVRHTDVSTFTYVDFATNSGRYATGTTNELLDYIRQRDGGVKIEYTGGQAAYTLPHEMISFDSVADMGNVTAIGYNYIVTVAHNSSQLYPTFTGNDYGIGADKSIKYVTVDEYGANNTFVHHIYSGANDYKVARLTKLVTDVTPAQMTGGSSAAYKGELVYRVGGGLQQLRDQNGNSDESIQGVYLVGGVAGVTNWASSTSDLRHGTVIGTTGWEPGKGAGAGTPLPFGSTEGDSGSPYFVWEGDAETGSYKFLMAHRGSTNNNMQTNGCEALEWTQNVMQADSFCVDMSTVSGALNINGAETPKDDDGKGGLSDTINGVTFTAVAAQGFLSHNDGNLYDKKWNSCFNAVETGQNTWKSLSDLKNSDTWYAYGNEYLNATESVMVVDKNVVAATGLTYAKLFQTQNLVFEAAADNASYTINVTKDTDLGTGYLHFAANGKKNVSFNVAPVGSNQLNSAGYVVDAGVQVNVSLRNADASYMREWRKVGEGTLNICGNDNNEIFLNVGGKGKTLLNQEEGYAAYNVLVNTGSTVVIKDTTQIYRDLTFGNGGGTLDMNGTKMDWYLTKGETRDGFTINALTEEAVISNSSSDRAVLNFKETGNQKFVGSFRDSKDSALGITYAGGGIWELNGIRTSLENADSGLTVENGTVKLAGSLTVHGYGTTHTRETADFTTRDKDWHYADAKMNVTVQKGATFELESHARLTGTVTVQEGGKYVMHEGVQYDQEYIEGGEKLESTADIKAYYGHKGDVKLAKDATLSWQRGSTELASLKGTAESGALEKVESTISSETRLRLEAAEGKSGRIASAVMSLQKNVSVELCELYLDSSSAITSADGATVSMQETTLALGSGNTTLTGTSLDSSLTLSMGGSVDTQIQLAAGTAVLDVKSTALSGSLTLTGTAMVLDFTELTTPVDGWVRVHFGENVKFDGAEKLTVAALTATGEAIGYFAPADVGFVYFNIPEPATATLSLLALAALAARRRRK